MKITESQLRRIIREEKRRLVEAPVGVQLEDLEPGEMYQVLVKASYGGSSPVFAEFVGWKLGEGGPRMVWKDEDDGTEWEAYLSNSVFSVGSSARPLRVTMKVKKEG